jgi:hypothetical protein
VPLILHNFAATRPYVYHLTAADNLIRICETARLESAASLMSQAGRSELLRRRRPEHTSFRLDSHEVILRDQAPLHAGNIAFGDLWTLEDLVETLNHLVFFWPGIAGGPSEYGRRHFERYRTEGPALLRIPTNAILAGNLDNEPLFCRYNSGSPRYSGGRASPRGPNTFVRAAEFNGGPRAVVEVTFRNGLSLPPETEYGFAPAGPWSLLL